jgi:hypothetical protein
MIRDHWIACGDHAPDMRKAQAVTRPGLSIASAVAGLGRAQEAISAVAVTMIQAAGRARGVWQ